jgi:hypothetical protein
MQAAAAKKVKKSSNISGISFSWYMEININKYKTKALATRVTSSS